MNSPAPDLLPADLPDEDLQALAAEWRRRALQGETFARCKAHEFEVELRRRRQLAGESLASLDALSPAPTLAEMLDRWRRWRAMASWGRRTESV